MARHSKRFEQARAAVDRTAQHSLGDAIDVLLGLPMAKFDESVEFHAHLTVDPTHADQQVRSTVTLPNGTGKERSVIVFASGDRAQEARDAGADEVGTDELAARIRGGWLDFEAAVATPDNMRIIGPLGRILGPRGLMPNARAGTVTNDVGRVVRELKAGRVEFRVDRLANLHVVAGRASMGRQALIENLRILIEAVVRVRPSAAKGSYISTMSICCSMGPSIRLDTQATLAEASAAVD
jgi:large subunit ribosomal protein L1